MPGCLQHSKIILRSTDLIPFISPISCKRFTMSSAEKSYIDTVEDASTEDSRTVNNTIPGTFDGLSDEEYRALEKKCKFFD